ncbi:MAG: hypothetical protein ACRDHZ_17105 [Ktedonobacteraceae bacterium]
MFAHHHSQRTIFPLLLLCTLLGLSLVACGSGPGNASANGSNTPSSSNAGSGNSSPGQPAQSVFTVNSVDISVNPANLSSYACGTQLKVTYTATFHFPANNPGGQAMFQWTTNNGRGSTQATLTVPPGTTSMPYLFTWSGQLPPDHTQPGLGGVIVTWPVAYNSSLIGPTGTCSVAQSVPLKVASVDITVSPSLNGTVCGTNITVTYTATFHFPANNAGGHVTFSYTTTNGRGSAPASLTVPPGTTSLAYTFTWHGPIHTNQPDPGAGGVLVSAPNAYTSPLVNPTGSCH